MNVASNSLGPTFPTFVVGACTYSHPSGKSTSANVCPNTAVNPAGASHSGSACSTLIVTVLSLRIS